MFFPVVFMFFTFYRVLFVLIPVSRFLFFAVCTQNGKYWHLKEKTLHHANVFWLLWLVVLLFRKYQGGRLFPEALLELFSDEGKYAHSSQCRRSGLPESRGRCFWPIPLADPPPTGISELRVHDGTNFLENMISQRLVFVLYKKTAKKAISNEAGEPMFYYILGKSVGLG